MENNKIMPKVFGWMFIGLLITFLTGYFVSNNDNMIYNLFATNLYYFIWIAELIVVVVLAARIRKMQPMTAITLFIVYAILTGLTMSSIFLLFEMESIMVVFLITSVIFLLFAIVGFFTKLDLTKLSTFFLMALLGIILVSVVNLFLNSTGLEIGLCIVGVVLFVGIVAYDIQIIKRNAYLIEDENKVAIYGAFQLYLDFINIFLRLLTLFGKSKD